MTIIAADNRVFPTISYYGAFGNMMSNQNDLTEVHKKYFGKTKELANYATQSAKDAALATIYVATLMHAGYTWNKKLLLDFSKKLIHENKDNPEELREDILRSHITHVVHLFNNTHKETLHVQCCNTLNRLNKEPEFKDKDIPVDGQLLYDAKYWRAFINYQKKNEFTLNGYDSFIHSFVDNEILKENMGNLISLTTNAKAFQIN